METSNLESPMNESADRFMIGRRDLERSMQSIFEQLTGRSQNNTSRRNHDLSYTEPERRCGCCCGDRNEAPSFSVLLDNPSHHTCNSAHSPYRTAGNHRKVLQIHLPESSKDPCQILITSHRDQVSVKYLQQGQQFSFSTNDCDGSLPKTPVSATSDQTFSNRERDQIFSNSESDQMSSNAKTEYDKTLNPASKSLPKTPMSVTIDRVFSNVQIDRMFSNAATDRVFSNTETDQTMFSNTKTDGMVSHAENVQTGRTADRSHKAIPQKGYLPNSDDSESSRHARNTSSVTSPTIQRRERIGPSNYVSVRNVPRRSMQDTSTKQLGNVLESVDVEKANDNNTLLPSLSEDVSSISMDRIDTDSHGNLPAKRQKKQSLNTFIDSLLNKRTREESRKSLDHLDRSMECGDDQESSFEIPHGRETMETRLAEESGFVVVNTNKPANNLFPSKTLGETQNPAVSPLTQTINSRQRFQESEPAKTVVKKSRFKCQYCSKLFQERSDCLVHISKQHVEQRPHRCTLCDATFKKERSLKYHIRHHNGERRYKCTFCDKAFKEKYHLTVHIRTHTGERPFACSQCGKAFKQTNELTSHIRTHTGEKPYKCNLCDKWFKRRSQLYNHKLSHLSQAALDISKNDEVDSYDNINTEISSLQETPTSI